jgi:hypothetical protein
MSSTFSKKLLLFCSIASTAPILTVQHVGSTVFSAHLCTGLNHHQTVISIYIRKKVKNTRCKKVIKLFLTARAEIKTAREIYKTVFDSTQKNR